MKIKSLKKSGLLVKGISEILKIKKRTRRWISPDDMKYISC